MIRVPESSVTGHLRFAVAARSGNASPRDDQELGVVCTERPDEAVGLGTLRHISAPVRQWVERRP